MGIVIALAGGSASAQNKILTELDLVRMFQERSILGKAYDAQAAGKTAALSMTQETYGTRLKASASALQSRESPVTMFQPTFTPVNEYSSSILQKMPYGISLEGGIFAAQRSALDRSFENATQVGAKISLRLELLKNRFGSMDSAQLGAAESRKKRGELEARLSKKQQEVSIRKLFWSLVANWQSLELSKKLQESAARQLKYAEDRRRVGVADVGEIARYKSQLQSRIGSVLLFQHEREMLWQTIQRQIRDFNPSEYRLDGSFLDSSQRAITQCLQKVVATKKIDRDASLFDDVIDAYKTELANEIKVAEQHGSPQLSLVGISQISGTNDSYSGALDHLTEKKQTSNIIGLELDIPLGGQATNTEQALIRAKQHEIEAQYEQLQSDLRATFQTMESNLLILQKGLQNQADNSANLKIGYRDTLKKFDQGRVPLSIVITEQDALFQSELQELTFRKQITHALLDYFAVFSEFPCSWNQLNSTSSSK
jgi:outer membrane protein TolC